MVYAKRGFVMQHRGQLARKFIWLLWIVLVASACGSATTDQATADTSAESNVETEVGSGDEASVDPVEDATTAAPETAASATEPPATTTVETTAPETLPPATRQSDEPDSDQTDSDQTDSDETDETAETTTTESPTTTAPATTTQPATTQPTTTQPSTTTTTAAPTTTSQVETLQPVRRGPFVCEDPCNVVIEGDSLTRGLVDRLCNQVTDLGNCHNSGVGGDRTDEMLASAPADVDSRVGNGSDDLLFLWAGTNDLWQRFHDGDPQTNAEMTAAIIETYISERRAAGWDYVVLMNLPPMIDVVQGVDELNALIAGIDADAHIDLNADPLVSLGNENGFRTQDGVHFSREGYNYVMDTYYIPMVLELRG